MTLPVLFLISSAFPQYADTPPAEPAVQVWLDEDGRYERGDEARVFARAAYDGYLVVLHADPDGRVRVLFPVDPGVDDFVRGAEGIEIRGRADRDAFLVEQASGAGTVLAAWSRDPFRFDPFVRGDHWDYRELAPAGVARDPEAGLLDIVHRMAAGAPYDYDVAPYVVGRQASSAYFDGYTIERRTTHVTVAYEPWGCYGCYDPWRYGWNAGFGVGFGSWYVNVGFGSPWYGYRPYYAPYYYRPWRWSHGYGSPWYWGPYPYRPVVVWSRPWRGPVRVGHPYDGWCGYRCDRGPRPGHAVGIRLADQGLWPEVQPRSSRPADARGITRQTLQMRLAESTPAIQPRSARDRAAIGKPEPSPTQSAGAPIWPHRSSIPESDPFRRSSTRAVQSDRDTPPRQATRVTPDRDPRPTWRSTTDRGSVTRSAPPEPSTRARPRTSEAPPSSTPRTRGNSRIWTAEPPSSTARPRSGTSTTQGVTVQPRERGRATTPQTRPTAPPERRDPSSILRGAPGRSASPPARAPSTRAAPSRSATPRSGNGTRSSARPPARSSTTRAPARGSASGKASARSGSSGGSSRGGARASGRARGSGG